MLYYRYIKSNVSDLNNNSINSMNKIQNNNENNYFNSQEENFSQALILAGKDFSENELFSMLKNGNITQKQIAALRIKTIKSEPEAQIFLDNLTGQDGKIREAVSLRINEFMSESTCRDFFKNTVACDKFLDAITDINGNICRNIINAVSNIKTDKQLSKYYTEKLTAKIWQLYDIIKDFDLQDGKYKVNKEVFKLYWCLESLYDFACIIDLEELKKILSATSSVNDYTIREKTARILTLNFHDPQLAEIKNMLKNDNNYYVRRF